MKPLTIELAKDAQRHLQCLGWKSGDDCSRRFFSLDQDGKPVVVTPKPAMPEFYDPNRRAKAVFCGEPFPEAVCVEISPCLLLPPPCYRTREEFESQLPGHYHFEPWRAIYWETHRQVLILEPSGDEPLQERLDKWLAAMRKAYEYEAGAWRDRIKWATTAALQELGFDTEEQRATRLAELQGQLAIVESEESIDGVPCKGRLRLTLDDVKRGHEGIRDAWMHEDWANKNGEDLGVMARERRAFRRWLETHTGTRANIIDATHRVPDPNDPSKSKPTAYPGIAPPHFGERYEQDPFFVEACAQVRYRARFADNANTVVYLADCELREELTSPELDEVAKLKAVTQTIRAADLVNLRHSSNYRQLFWVDGGKEEQANLTKKQASAFSALHHAHGFMLAREEWQDEIYGDEPPNDFRPDKIFAYEDGRKVWNRFIRVDGDRYRLVIERE
jgi:hypothetical protein